ncbi:OPT oligopeptide transporter protein-domain-containing protein [Mycena floridula]|nr:OPT oligopeptide transporter protein-domain-containing protein [Mycena floridula]
MATTALGPGAMYHTEGALADVDILTSNVYSDPKTKRESSEYEDEKKGDDVDVIESGPDAYGGGELLDAKGNDDDPAYSVLPLIVRELCDFEDDINTPVLTFRFYLLSAGFTALGAWLTQMGFFRTTYIPYSIYFVQIASLYFGRLLAATLPNKMIGFGQYKMSLNPGSFTMKEHVTIVIAANTGATNNLGDYVLAPLALFYDAPMNGWLGLLFMISAVFVGFSFASFARMILIENPTTMFPRTLQQVSVFKAMQSTLGEESKTAKTQMRVFWYTILIFFIWQFLPEYIFPFTSSLAFLCWVSKDPKVQFLGSGLGGAGFLNITLDWSNIGSTFVIYPYWTTVNIFSSYVIVAWILIPVAYFTGIWESDKYPVQSQSLYLRNGSTYPTAQMMTSNYLLNQTLFDLYGPPMMSVQLRWNYFFSYVAWLGTFVGCALFHGPEIWATLKSQYTRTNMHEDKLSQMIRKYPAVPWWWNALLFFIPFIVLTALTATGVLLMPVYMLYIGLAIGAVIVVPMAYIYAITGYQMQVGYFNELFYGYAINLGGSRHPIGSLSYRVISGQCWYEAQAMLADMKLGHYFHIPPRAVLWAQIFGILVGTPVNYATILWVVKTKGDVLTGAASDPNRQWTGQTVISLYNQSISFALIGPQRLFNDPMYKPMLYGFILGAVLPVILFGLHRWKPKWRFDLWSVPIFASTFENYYGNISNFLFFWFILGTINVYVKKYRYPFWKKFAYLASAGADTGYNFNMLFLFIAFSAVKTIPMAAWWGNNTDSVERCFHIGGGL